MSDKTGKNEEAELFEDSKVSEESQSRPGTGRKIAFFLLFGFLAVFAVALVVFRDYLNFDALRRTIYYSGKSGERASEFVYRAGADGVFAPLGDGVVFTSTVGIQYLDRSGNEFLSEYYVIKTPAAAISDESVAAYGIGGTEVVVVGRQGILGKITSEREIISVSMNQSGYIAVTADESGRKGSVTVYDSELEPAYKWLSSEGYVLCSAISPDSRSVAAVSIAESDNSIVSSVILHDFNSLEEQGRYSVSGSLILHLKYLSRDRICAIGEKRADFITSGGEHIGTYEYEDQRISGFSTEGDGFVVLALSRYQSGTKGQLAVLNTDGTEGSTLEFNSKILAVSANGKYIAALLANEAVIYTSSLQEYARTPVSAGIKGIIMREDGTLLLTSAQSAQLYIP